MNPEQFVYDTLRTAPAVVAMIGARIFQDMAPENTATPYAVITKAEQQTEYGLDNTPLAVRASMQVAVWDQTRLRAETLGDAITAAMLAADTPEAARGGDYDSVAGLYGVTLDYDVWIL